MGAEAEALARATTRVYGRTKQPSPYRIPGQEARPLGIDAHDDIGLEGAGD